MSKIEKEKTDQMLTDVELELMTILWQIGEGSVADVIDLLPENRKLAYTSVSTILRILEQKQVLTTRKEGRGHIYIPVFEKTAYEARVTKHVIDKVFDGTPAGLIKQLIEVSDVTAEDIKSIRAWLNKIGSEK